MNIIFKREDFNLCEVPVPKGYPQSQTHAGIAIKEGAFFLTTSPFPNPIRPLWLRYLAAVIWRITFKRLNILYKGEDFENPLLYEAVQFNEHHIPTVFQLIKGSPLMKKPKDIYGAGSFCSDPDLSVIDGFFYVLNRTTCRGTETKSCETLVHLIIGHVVNGSFIQDKKRVLFQEDYKSPCLTKLGEKYYYFCLDTNSYNDGKPCKALLLRESEDMVHWSELKKVHIDKGDYEPWHMSVFKYKEKLYSIIACVKKVESHRCWQMLGEFNETLSELKIYPTPLTDYHSYRGAACITEKGDFVLYNTTVREKIKGSKSVDGRDVIMTHIPFVELIASLKECEN